MEVIGDTALAEAAPYGDALHTAAVRNGWFSEEAPPFDGCADAGFLDHALPFDDEYPDSFPEDPFPELLFEALAGEDPFPGGDSAADLPRLSLDDRVGAVKTLLRADLSAAGPGLIDEPVKLFV